MLIVAMMEMRREGCGVEDDRGSCGIGYNYDVVEKMCCGDKNGRSYIMKVERMRCAVGVMVAGMMIESLTWLL